MSNEKSQKRVQGMNQEQFLSFIGNGDFFNDLYGNTSACIKEDNHLLLIDCGPQTFNHIQTYESMKNIYSLDVLITHMHPDHVGGLGNLIMYMYYKNDVVTNIFHVNDSIAILLSLMGVKKDMYALHTDSKFKINEYNIEVVKQSHVNEISSYGYLISKDKRKEFYSGDTNRINNNILNMFFNYEIDLIYQDVCSYDYERNPHLSLKKLLNIIPKEDRKRIVPMHLDIELSYYMLCEYGFSDCRYFNG